ncbi:hypothetical protein MFIFM68171_00376 [Madurella fahalii]|uniref:Uncharacterized protein n=1 Tax=Madurella fahalii TaxID=1157608 RepID=A0ABQ0FXD0_9PEZI
MASLTQFYLTTLWAYTPKAIERVIEEFAGTELADAEITFDNDYHWFKVICREDQAHQARQLFDRIVGEIEEDAFGDAASSILRPDGAINTSFDNQWISDGHEHNTPASYRLPKMFSEFLHTAIWDNLDRDTKTLTIRDIATEEELAEIAEKSSITMSYDLSRRLVYIGGHAEKPVREVQEKLKVLLDIKKLSTRRVRIEHVLYAEDYVERNAPDFMAETRYLANIDPKLASSTLFDRARVRNLENAYKALYREGVSIRLCYWDPERQYWVSLLGPKVPGRSGKKSNLGNRPILSTKVAYNPPSVTGVIVSSLQHRETDTKVQSWIESVPDVVAPDSVPASYPKTYVPSAKPLLGSQAANKQPPLVSPPEAAGESLIDSLPEHIADMGMVTPKESNPTAPETVDKAAAIDKITRQLASLLMPLFPELLPDKTPSNTTQAGTMSKVDSDDDSPNEFQAKGKETLIDLQSTTGAGSSKNVPSPQISWDMPALIPQPVNTVQSRDSNLSRAHLGSGSIGFQPMNERTASRQAGKPLTKEQKNLQLELGEPDRLLATEGFTEEIEAAMAKLLATGPYRRGKLELRAELGRVLLMGLDLSALAFNDVNTPSNGWEKAELLKQLSVYFSEPQNIHFTKILTTYASDAEGMINIKTGGTRLWEEKPSSVWTVYSFRCALRIQHRLLQFVVDIEDDSTSSTPFSYLIRPLHGVDGVNGLLPLYVHAIRRNWDLEIRLSHVDTEEAEKALGSYAKTLLQTLSISHSGTGAAELKFAVPQGCGWDIKEARVLTKWRHPSPNNKSSLEITEVQQMEMTACSDDPLAASGGNWEVKRAQAWTQRAVQQKGINGECPRWYEAAVVSPEAEALFRENQSLGVGEKAHWTFDELKTRGILATVYGPALRMLREMDHVGRNDDNTLAAAYGGLLIKANKPPRSVPGLSPSNPRTRSGQSPAQGQNRRRRGRGSNQDGSWSSIASSSRPGTYSSSSNMSSRGGSEAK